MFNKSNAIFDFSYPSNFVQDTNKKEVSGIIKSIIFHSESNGFTIAKLGNNNKVKGYLPNPQISMEYNFEGKWEKHNQFGYTFSFNNYNVCYPKDVESIRLYLADNCKWIGHVISNALINKYGENTLKVCKEEPERVSEEIKGVTFDRAKEISNMLLDNEVNEEIQIQMKKLLSGIRISKRAIAEIVKTYKKDAPSVIKDNPYQLIDRINGIGFTIADQIAVKNGFDLNGEPRIKAGLIHTLKEATFSGHTCLPLKYLIGQTIDILSIQEAKIKAIAISMISSNDLIKAYDSIYLPNLHHKETNVAKQLNAILLNKTGVYCNSEQEAEEIIVLMEQEEDQKLYTDQKNALKKAIQNNIFILTGVPGSGKTFLLKRIINSFPKDTKIKLVAPTGKAAKRITEQSGMLAKTIHKLLEAKKTREGTFEFTKNYNNPIEADIIAVDECSMIDLSLMYSFLDAVSPKTKLIFIGDDHQLPSVGPGNILKDMISYGKIPHADLTIIKRQEDTTGLIVENCSKIKAGENIRLKDNKAKDFFFIKGMTEKKIQEIILGLITERLPKYYNADPLKDIQIISPLREKTELSCKKLNELCQEKLNKNKGLDKTIFRIGDKVIQTKNNYDLDIINGDIGYIESIDFQEKEICINFENPNRKVTVDLYNNNIELAYSLTCHKMQGSEARIIIIPIHKAFGTLIMQRNWLYTAISRAKEVCVLVGQETEIKKIIARNKQQRRFTNLVKFLEETETTNEIEVVEKTLIIAQDDSYDPHDPRVEEDFVF